MSKRDYKKKKFYKFNFNKMLAKKLTVKEKLILSLEKKIKNKKKKISEMKLEFQIKIEKKEEELELFSIQLKALKGKK